MGKLTYKDLFDDWLQARQKEMPDGLKPIQPRAGAPEPSLLNIADTQSFENSFSPYDLYLNPDKHPAKSDYPSPAYEIDSRDTVGLGPGKGIVLNTEEPNNLTNLISILQSSREDYTPEQQPYGAQGIYEHEVGHFLDPRLRITQNHGYLEKYGMSGDIASREEPAFSEEDAYWDRMRNFLEVMQSQKGKK